MHLRSSGFADTIPTLVPDLAPPLVLGTAALADRAFAGAGLNELLRLISRPAVTGDQQAAFSLDASLACQMTLAEQWPVLQRAALGQCRLFRVEGGFVPRSANPLRVLALVAPGDLMTNTPLDFITAHLDVRLDLLFVVPGQPLPTELPDHDIAFFAVSDSVPATLRRLAPLFRAWPRPALNDPEATARLSRDGVPRLLADVPGLCSPETVCVDRPLLLAHLAGERGLEMLASGKPVLIRPLGSHAGRDLRKIEAAGEIAAYLERVREDAYYLTPFIDYRSADGYFRKYRVVLIDGRPMLCHMAVSRNWMVHYLNAEMTEHQFRRDEEARAMDEFETGFAARHAEALGAVHERLGLDYIQLDCAETPDGNFLLFEADTAAIVHMMDPPGLFPYKHAHMRRVFAAFEAMLRRRVAEG